MKGRRIEHQHAEALRQRLEFVGSRRLARKATREADIVVRPPVRDWEREHQSELTQPVRIVLVDDHRFVRELINRMLSRQPERYSVVGEAPDGTTVIALCQQHTPHLPILEINLPDISGIDAVPSIRRVPPHVSESGSGKCEPLCKSLRAYL